MKKTILFLLGLSIAGIILATMYVRDDEPVARKQPAVDADLSLEGVTLRQGKDGRLVWTLNATSADYRKEQGFVVVSDPEILYFQEGESEPVYVEGDHGRIDQKNDQADIWSNVVARYQGSRLTTASLHYNGTSSQLFFREDVVIRGRDMVLTADSATAELATKRLAAHGRVKAVLNAGSRIGGE